MQAFLSNYARAFNVDKWWRIYTRARKKGGVLHELFTLRYMRYASKSDRYHSNLYIYEDLTIECQDCLNRDSFFNWKFKCCAHDFLFPSSSPKTMIEVLHSLEADLYFIDNCLEAFAKKRTEFFLNI